MLKAGSALSPETNIAESDTRIEERSDRRDKVVRSKPKYLS
jgi:hypothetical protein